MNGRAMHRDSVTLNDLRAGGFRLWFKLCLLVALHTGFAFGLVSLLFGLVGLHAHADIFGLHFQGVAAGLVNLVWGPLLALVAAVPLSAIAYWPFRWSSGMLCREP